MAEDGNLEWVFDSLVEFLKGPVWNIPVVTFIEQKSVVFEPGDENEEEFRKIHDHYKNLVDFMLGSYMEDIRITPEQFEKACSVASKKALTQFHQNLFEQVWAADDYEIFRRMMTQKNLELQLQALEVLAQKYGLSPDFMEPTGECKPNAEEEEVMKEIIRKAVLEQESEEKIDCVSNEDQKALEQALEVKSCLETQRQKEKELLNLAMQMSLKEARDSTDSPQSFPLEVPPTPNPSPITDVEKEKNETSTEDIISPTANEECVDKNTEPKTLLPSALVAIAQTVPLSRESFEQQDQPVNDALPKEANESESDNSSTGSLNVQDSAELMKNSSSLSNLPKSPERAPVPQQRPWSDGMDQESSINRMEITPIDMERRQNYLRQQRDKLLAMKRQERSKNLSTYERTTVSEQRPKSARAARKILRQESSENIDPQTLAFRKSLASRLKNEVVDSTV